MIKRYLLRKLSIAVICLLIVIGYVLFPIKNRDNDFKTNLNYIDSEKLSEVYLMDKNNYLSLTNLQIDSTELKNKLVEKINLLIINGKYKDRIPSSFKCLIPENTKLLNLDVEKDTVTVNFSKEFLNVSKESEEKMIESIIFTLTENETIRKVILKVDNKVLETLPHSKKKLPPVLTRKYGINKKYNINKISNISSTVIFYTSIINDETYYTPVTLISNDDREKAVIIISELKSSSVFQNNLSSSLNTNVSLVNYEEIDDVMYLAFNEAIYDNSLKKEILESVKYTISMSIKENYDVDEVVFKINE